MAHAPGARLNPYAKLSKTDHFRATSLGKIHVIARKENRPVCTQRPEQINQDSTRGGIEAGGWFIRDNDLHIAQRRRRQEDFLARAKRHLLETFLQMWR